MSSQTIGQGAGNLVPDQTVMEFLADEAIAIGEVVTFKSADTTGYTIVQADTDDANKIGLGVAKQAIAAGKWGPVIVGGFVPYLVTDGNIAAGSPITLTATAGAVGVGTVGTHDILGIAHAADSGTVCTAATWFRRL